MATKYKSFSYQAPQVKFNLQDAISKEVTKNLSNIDFSNLQTTTTPATTTTPTTTTTTAPTTTTSTPTTTTPIVKTPEEILNEERTQSYEERVHKAKMGDTDGLGFTGALDTQMGRTLTNNINEQMGGKESNALLMARQSGNEALARKAQDIRGAAAQNSIMQGQLGQGMAQTGKMQAEMQTMQQMGDFQTNMAAMAAQEQQNSQAQALQALGLYQQDQGIAETKRQAIVSEAQTQDQMDKNNLIDIYREASAAGASGTAGITLDKLTGQYLTQSELEQARAGDIEAAEYLETTQQVTALLNTKSGAELANSVEERDGKFYFNGSDQEIPPALAATITSAIAADPEAQVAMEFNNVKSGDVGLMSISPTLQEQLSTSPQKRAELGYVEKSSITKSSVDVSSWDGWESGTDSASVRKSYESHIGKIMWVDGQPVRVTKVDMGYHDGWGMNDAYYKATLVGVDQNGNPVNIKSFDHNA
jgi:hypothetical protein